MEGTDAISELAADCATQDVDSVGGVGDAGWQWGHHARECGGTRVAEWKKHEIASGDRNRDRHKRVGGRNVRESALDTEEAIRTAKRV